MDDSESNLDVVGFVDDDPNKKGAQLHGVKVLGTVSELETLSFPFDELLITMPSATGDALRRITACGSTGKKFKTVPSLSELIDKDVSQQL